jgi:hypothetical protein
MTSPLSLALGSPAKAIEFPVYRKLVQFLKIFHCLSKFYSFSILLTWSVIGWGLDVFFDSFLGPFWFAGKSTALEKDEFYV